MIEETVKDAARELLVGWRARIVDVGGRRSRDGERIGQEVVDRHAARDVQGVPPTRFLRLTTSASIARE